MLTGANSTGLGEGADFPDFGGPARIPEEQGIWPGNGKIPRNQGFSRRPRWWSIGDSNS